MKLDKNMVVALLAFGGGKGGGIVPSGALSISANGTYDVGAFASAVVAVPASAVVSGTKSISANGTHDVTAFANAEVLVPASAVCSGTKSISENGIHDVVGFANVDVNVAAVSNEDGIIDRTISGTYVNNNIMTIGPYAFYSCSRLKSVTFNLASQIGMGTFGNAKSLVTVNAPYVSIVGASAFYGCALLQSLSIYSGSNGANSGRCAIGPYAFYSCQALSRFDYPYMIIYNNAFASCSGLEYAHIKAIAYEQSNEGAGCFKKCTKLKTLVLEDGVANETFFNMHIGSSFCDGCSSLETLQINSYYHQMNIESYAFRSCYMLSNIVSFVSARYIANGAFQYCSQLSVFKWKAKKDNFNQPVISPLAFAGCVRLMSFYIMDLASTSLPKLSAATAFNSTPIAGYTDYTSGSIGTIYVLSDYYSYYISATNWVTYSSRIVSLTAEEMEAVFTS